MTHYVCGDLHRQPFDLESNALPLRQGSLGDLMIKIRTFQTISLEILMGNG